VGLQKQPRHQLPIGASGSLIPSCVGWFFESVVGRILDSGCQLKTVVGFKFYLPGRTCYRYLQQFILVVIQLVILIGILHHEDQDQASSDSFVRWKRKHRKVASRRKDASRVVKG
jgi:hypothetical protein